MWSNSLNIFQTFPAPQNYVETHIELHQRYVSNGNYGFFIVVNGEEIYSLLNTDVRQIYVKVYASDPWYDFCQGTVKNLKLISCNFYEDCILYCSMGNL